MHASMTELLENVKHGLVWVGANGTVRFANRSGQSSTGLAAGTAVADGALARAVTHAAMGGMERQITVAQPGLPNRRLDCRVIPGIEGDDAFVLVTGGDAPDDATGVDTLTHAIRHDLRDPLRAAHAALQLAQQGAGDADGLAVETLLDQIDRLLALSDKLVDLATLWDAGALQSDDRIELWPLLQQVWGEVEPMAMTRRVRVRFTTNSLGGEMATLYGSRRWMRRVFVECLEGAIRATPRGGELEVSHLQEGARASIVVHDTPLFDYGAHGADAVAHRLCKHVLALHGGRLREAFDGERRHLQIELPTGAPHRNPEPQLAIAQAQHYARDLAALMNRARKPAHAAPVGAN